MRRSNPTPILALGALALALILAETAAAQVSLGPRVAAGLPEVRLVERSAEKLELDEKTIAAVQKLAADATTRDEKLGEKLKNERLKLRDLLDQDLPEEAALMKQAEVLSGMTSEMQKNQLDTTLRVRALLNPEQRKTFMEIRKTAKPPRRQRRPR
jgi:Spy/CpxP family protein refolding chaperone